MKKLPEIWNCPDSLEFQCPQQWELLNTTRDNDVRHCSICSQNVYVCLTSQEFIQNAKSGKCVAIPHELAHRPNNPQYFLGRPSQEEVVEIEKEEELVSKFINWWKKILASEPSFFQNFVSQCYKKSYLKDQQKGLALEFLELEQFDAALEIVRSKASSEGFLKRIVEKLVSMGQLDIALEVAAIFEVSNYKVISLNNIALGLAKLGQIERAVNTFGMSLETARNLVRASEHYEAEVFRLAALANITLKMHSNNSGAVDCRKPFVLNLKFMTASDQNRFSHSQSFTLIVFMVIFVGILLTSLSAWVWRGVSDTFAKQTLRAFKANPTAPLEMKISPSEQ
jgi:tetratricopeptide (TPR) repeat protein